MFKRKLPVKREDRRLIEFWNTMLGPCCCCRFGRSCWGSSSDLFDVFKQLPTCGTFTLFRRLQWSFNLFCFTFALFRRLQWNSNLWYVYPLSTFSTKFQLEARLPSVDVFNEVQTCGMFILLRRLQTSSNFRNVYPLKTFERILSPPDLFGVFKHSNFSHIYPLKAGG